MFNKLISVVLTTVLAIFGAYFSTLLGMAISSNIVEHNAMPDSALPYFVGAVVSFYLGTLWQKAKPKK